MAEVVLPALGMFPANLALAEMVWDVLAPLPFAVRAEVSFGVLEGVNIGSQ
jgi:hypothetical protein